MKRPVVDPLESLARDLDALGRGLASQEATPLPQAVGAMVQQRRSRWMLLQMGIGAGVGAIVVAGVVGVVVALNASPKEGPFVKPPTAPLSERLRDRVPMDAPSSMASLRKATNGTEGEAMLEKLPTPSGGGDGHRDAPLQGAREK